MTLTDDAAASDAAAADEADTTDADADATDATDAALLELLDEDASNPNTDKREIYLLQPLTIIHLFPLIGGEYWR